MTNQRLKEYLDDNYVNYECIKHLPAFTAQETAHISHIKDKELAKVVILKADGKFLMMVLPANFKVNLEKLRHEIKSDDLALATEYEFEDQFNDCELGAMSPFGNLYDLPIYADDRLCDDRSIAFNAGTHSELIRIDWKDYLKLAHPKIVHLH